MTKNIATTFVNVIAGKSKQLPHKLFFSKGALQIIDGQNIQSFSPLSAPLSSTLFETRLGFSTNLISNAELETTSTFLNALEPQTATSFEAVAPDANILIGMGITIILCIIGASVWANEVVPVSRTKLAISKNRGQVKEYLDELKANDVDSNIDTINSEIKTGDTSFVLEDENRADNILANEMEPNKSKGNRNIEKWLFADWLNDNKSANKKPAAVPFLKDAKWNSGDNPVVVTSALLLVCIVFASVTERAGMMGVR